ncbi:deoxyribose-phosphate aldolase [Paenibacillus senegalensis]|uniref:deoxyribose-phosphate aldolase n=1 Tax=Paenibacillus senegalensis TaxID=1465766 RepID=UPI00028866CB|nr:deoxyribose-phosphate aldolase [Paenibacillus senegalensis]
MAQELHRLPAYIDHTLLKPEAGRKEFDQLCKEAMEYGFYSVCVNSAWVAYCRELLAGTPVKISAVCGFPLGAQLTSVKAFEAAKAVERGAAEIDMVINLGLLLDGEWKAVEDDIRQVVLSAGNDTVVKVILETGFLTNPQKQAACQAAEQAGAHFVKTSTGFGPGGATVEDVKLMKASISPSMRVKASGGIRDTAAAMSMIEAGAARLGTSSGVTLMRGSRSEDAY